MMIYEKDLMNNKELREKLEKLQELSGPTQKVFVEKSIGLLSEFFPEIKKDNIHEAFTSILGSVYQTAFTMMPPTLGIFPERAVLASVLYNMVDEKSSDWFGAIMMYVRWVEPKELKELMAPLLDIICLEADDLKKSTQPPWEEIERMAGVKTKIKDIFKMIENISDGVKKLEFEYATFGQDITKH